MLNVPIIKYILYPLISNPNPNPNPDRTRTRTLTLTLIRDLAALQAGPLLGGDAALRAGELAGTKA